ncbi:MAG: hypothetical protein QXK72_06875, partial [Candidatus Bathyarchaeia archaeon]
GDLGIKVKVEYQRGGVWRNDSEQSYKTMTVNIYSGVREWPLPEWWNRLIEKPVDDYLVRPIKRLFGLR